MKTDRQLHFEQNILVAEKVFGDSWVREAKWEYLHQADQFLCIDQSRHANECLPKYVQDLNAAFQVVTRMLQLDFDFTLDMKHNFPDQIRFFHKRSGVFVATGPGSVPAMICKAALEAVGAMGPVPR